MVPHSLYIKNFLSYGSQGIQVQFDPYHLICLSGKNGHGKSALLDAMTWAVWGQARKTLTSVKPDQGLLHLGQSHMMVIFEFSCKGQQFRIKREYMHHHAKPYAQLEFALMESTGTVTPLTDKTIKATQAVINNTIKLDYESFINTAFLRQGNSNEFSKKSAKERKEILASILGLNSYEKARKYIFDKIRTMQLEQAKIQTVQNRLVQECSTKEPLQEHHQKALDTITSLEQQLSALHEKKQLSEATKNKIVVLAEQLRMKQETLNALQKQYAELLAHTKTAAVTWRKKNYALGHSHSIEQVLEEKNKLVALLDIHQKNSFEQIRMEKQIMALESQKQNMEKRIAEKIMQEYQAWSEQKHTLEKERHELAFSIEQIEHQKKQLVDEYIKLKEHIAIFDATEDPIIELDKMGLQFVQLIERKKLFFQKLTTHGNELTKENYELELKMSATGDAENPSCPLCEQNLSLARKKFLRVKFQKTYHRIQHQLNRIKKIIPLLKQWLIAQHETLLKIEHQKADYAQKKIEYALLKEKAHEYETKIQQYTRHIQEIEQKQRTIQEKIKTVEQDERKDVTRIANLLGQNSEFLELNTQIEAIQETIVKSAHRQLEYESTKQKLDQINLTLQEHASIEKTQAVQAQLAQTVANQVRTLKQYKKQMQTYKSLDKEKITIEQNIMAINLDIETHAKNIKQLTLEKEAQIRISSAVGKELETVSQKEKEVTELEIQLKKIEVSIADYQIICQAMSKDGIQALLIEEAIPELEAEANSLLSKLTNNSAHIFIESLKDLKNGGTKETLDIKIADHIGIRPYELFSGGEAFRIDFALRIAISKLLARRAGTSLQTLIIDEGFGSQDEEGLNNIMDALYKIQNDFSKIIIVSHLTSMKDQFPVHFVIEKGPQGSNLTILEMA